MDGVRDDRPVASAAQQEASLGWLPLLALVMACGFLLVALGDMAGRAAMRIAEPLFWLGLLLLFVPAIARLIWPGPSRAERLSLVVFLGLGLYGVKLLHSPLEITFFDEFIHWRTASDITTSHHLFNHNSLLPASPLYPSMEMFTSAIVALSGLSIFASGVVVMFVGRLILVLALFSFYEQVSDSPRLAGLATLLYMANPNFLYFDAQFSYESLSLPIVMVVLYVVARRASLDYHKRALTAVAVLSIAMVITTHHLSSYALIGFLVLWSATVFWRGGSTALRDPFGPGGAALFTIVLAIIWLLSVATVTIGYLEPNFVSAVEEVTQLILRENSGRQLFHSPSNAYVTPTWERYTALSAVAIIVFALPGGLLRAWTRYRSNALALSLAVAAAMYPVTLAFRLTSAGAEISNRSSEFIFVPVAFVLALALTEVHPFKRITWPKLALVMPWAGIILVGGIITGWPPWARLPGPYLVVADSRSIEPEGVDAAMWASGALGTNNRMASDRINSLLMESYGRQDVVTHLADFVFVYPLYLSPNIGPTELAVIHNGHIRYVEVDMRLTAALPQGGSDFEGGPAMSHPIPVKDVDKFDTASLVSRVFDSGNIVIYDVKALDNASQ